ncbi:unnamed protein product [Arabidopsis thaliana]|uniref:Uncharacterized protein n=2 Tax=Arabidopsis thaliana TaxID=3702 RepID=A0A654F4M0_ARATH|nr:uncharacterized protein AT2G18025 [Arabidopsis thaliana]ANM61917.1 hypothetical protein AT2G18025 [Arabidopsis thaliana]CAA0364783.1 unnamed protein product [Arabidopsis thaliana]VYS52701.1 unnamed protein product [Arabidopsis thaliana]|eukprot:NP_001324106.1 hypothetical protein AT2G18025 [Arabidopsis thaliana]
MYSALVMILDKCLDKVLMWVTNTDPVFSLTVQKS